MTTSSIEASRVEATDSSVLVGRRAQIDGLRALAMAGVLYVHLWNEEPVFAYIRVALFFTVSGFLITAILLAARDKGGRINVLNFYVRRLLRLMPALVIVIAISTWFDIDGFRSSAAWHLLQATNLYFAVTEQFRPWIMTQVWSLNILEQFYLVWPPIILLLSLTRVYVVTLTIFVGTIVLRANAWVFGFEGYWPDFVFAYDPIALGAFACLLMRTPAVRAVLLSSGATGAAVLFLASPSLLGPNWSESDSYRLLSQVALAVLICGAYAGWRGPVGALLASRPARFLSQISYGVFIYHLLVWWAIAEVWDGIWIRGPRTFVIVSAATIGVAWLSWVAVERPLSRLKRHFPTSSPRPVSPSTDSAASGLV